MKKLSKTKKIKRLKAIRITLLRSKCDYFFMCHFYSDNYGGNLFIDIPELYKYRPKSSMIYKNDKQEAWTFTHTNLSEWEGRQQAIDKAIKLIQSK